MPSSTQRIDVGEIREAYRLVAAYVYGELGRFAYRAFDFINATYFADARPETLILWHLTDHGRELGWCRSCADGPPIILLHPWLVEPPACECQTERWHNPVELYGLCYAFDVLLHECIHAH